MTRWFMWLLVGTVVMNLFLPLLERWGIGRLPGDWRFRMGGRVWCIPFGSVGLISLLIGLLKRWI
jgi:hypothetical protein